ncbi:GNAT family N-acetyltransferase [Rhizobium sp. 18055]|uniref:GNAT family N-acetyltransferase n=1 Tax=Rhizobium sp. 18055 TaxID=2681403 RepID=UPI001356A78D|nr:GNAT family N-acetyltransferase [Rhizobium sp. 18055]
MTSYNVPLEERIEIRAFLDLFRLAPKSLAAEAALAYLSIEGGCAVSLPFAPPIGLNRILGLRDLASLEKAIRWFDRRGGAPRLQIDENVASADVLGWIAHQGMAKSGPAWVKLTCSAPSSPVLWTSDIEIRAAGIGEAKLFAELMCEGFGFPKSLAPFWAGIVARPGWTCLVAYIDKVPAGTGIMYAADGYAWLGGGTTIAAFRNRGVQTALIRARMNLGAEQGVKIFAVETAEPEPGKYGVSFENVVKAGFRQVFVRQNYLINPS